MTVIRLFDRPRPLAPADATQIERVRELAELPDDLRARVEAARRSTAAPAPEDAPK